MRPWRLLRKNRNGEKIVGLVKIFVVSSGIDYGVDFLTRVLSGRVEAPPQPTLSLPVSRIAGDPYYIALSGSLCQTDSGGIFATVLFAY